MSLVRYNSLAEIPQPTEAEIKAMLAFEDEDLSDCPEQTPEELAEFRPYKVLYAEREKRRLEQAKKVKLAS
jgi:hypothetical protein